MRPAIRLGAPRTMLLYPPQNVPPDVFVREAKTALLGYLRRFLQREGIPPTFT